MKFIYYYIMLTSCFLFFTGQEVNARGTNKKPGPFAREIRLGGNAYVTTRTDQTAIRIDPNGVRRWSDPGAVFSAWFRTSKSGDLDLYLKYQADSAAAINVSCSGKSFHVKIRPGKEQTVYIGSVPKADTGYLRVDFRGVKRQGSTYAEAFALIVDGSAVKQGICYVNDFSFYWGRRGPSVHLGYPLPENETIEWFYTEVTVPAGGDPAGTYYMANGFAQGYFGMQANSSTERRVLFSVWSPWETDNPKEVPETHQVKMLRKGGQVKTGEFGNEGSGGQSYLIYPWQTGNTYKFLTQIKPDGKGNTRYTAWFYTPDEQEWLLIASFLRPLTNTYYKGAHSFLESFSPESGFRLRKAFYGNQWARTKEGKWIEIKDQVRFTVDETGRKKARMDYKGGIESGRFFLQNCGFLSDYTPIGTKFSRTSASQAPEIDLDKLP